MNRVTDFEKSCLDFFTRWIFDHYSKVRKVTFRGLMSPYHARNALCYSASSDLYIKLPATPEEYDTLLGKKSRTRFRGYYNKLKKDFQDIEFWENVKWGDIDCMFVDCPPGTGDVPLTVFQSLPVAGIVVVTSPQELVSMIVEKAVNMANMMDIPVLGIVENMSYFECPDCGKKHEIFGKSHIDEIAAQHDIKAVAKLPINPEAASKVDGGFAEDLDVSALDNIFEAIRNC